MPQTDQSLLNYALIGYQSELEKIDERIAEIRSQLGGREMPTVATRRLPTAGTKRHMSASGKARIIAAQRKRWREARRKAAEQTKQQEEAKAKR
jgi:hypothetical protein